MELCSSMMGVPSEPGFSHFVYYYLPAIALQGHKLYFGITYKHEKVQHKRNNLSLCLLMSWQYFITEIFPRSTTEYFPNISTKSLDYHLHDSSGFTPKSSGGRMERQNRAQQISSRVVGGQFLLELLITMFQGGVKTVGQRRQGQCMTPYYFKYEYTVPGSHTTDHA